jgi:Zn-dependent M28 family amino/carboxypeptidase
MRVARRYGVVAATAALALAGGSALTAPAAAQGQGNPNTSKKFTAAVTADGVYRHLEAFQEIADDNGGNRASGTSGYEASGEYVESQLQAAGYETERQYFEFLYQEVITESLVQNTPETNEIDTIVMAYSPNTPEGGVTGDLVVPGEVNTGCDSSEWGEVDATDQIALVSRGVCSFAAKAVAAGEAGAEAVIIYNNIEGDLNGTLGGENDAFVPATGISQEAGQALLTDLAEGSVNVTLDLQVFSETRETFNVLAETAAGRDDNVVMLGAHLDSVNEGAGINDNGSGSAGILEVAIQLAKVKKLNNTVRFAWWGAEELGLIGSYEYVESLSEEELGNIATYLNFDMIASPNYIIGVYDADESTYTAPVPVPDGSIATEAVFTDYFDSIGQPWVDTEFSGRSDYQAFILAGVPASGLFTGADGVKSEDEVELFGGEAGIIYDPNYHTPEDDITNVDVEALEIMSKAIAHATITLAYDTSAINGKTAPGKSGCAGKSCDAPGLQKKAEHAHGAGHAHDEAA